jgi:hypothetical protein
VSKETALHALHIANASAFDVTTAQHNTPSMHCVKLFRADSEN